MEKTKIAILALFIVAAGTGAKAQDASSQDTIVNGAWTIGIGMNVLVDNGKRFQGIFLKNSWNAVPYPSRFSIERETGNGFSMELAYTHNQILAGKIVDRGVNPTTRNYNAIDLALKYNLHIFFDNSKFWIKPFILGGAGYSNMYPYPSNENDGSFVFRNLSGFASVNVGAGFDVCFNNIFPASNFLRHFALGFQTMGKFTDESSDLIQHSITLLYRIPQRIANTPAPAVIVIPAPLLPDVAVQFSVQAPSSVPGQHVVIETLPLCNYIFFDSGSTNIPVRYTLLTKDQALNFTEIQLQDCQKNPGTRSSRQLAMYYNLLNIIGDRMRKYPSSTIHLVGASGGRGKEIGKQNAEAVKSYLVNEFGIDGARITVEGRNQPIIPSEEPTETRDFALTRAEDNSVIITSTSPNLMVEVKDNSALCLRPIEVTAMDGSSADDAEVNLNLAGAQKALSTWSVDVTDAQGNIEHFGPFTSDKQTISGSAILQNKKSGDYTIVMTGQTKAGNTITKETTFTLVREVQPVLPEQRVSILFQFDKSVMVATFSNFLTNTVAPLIPSNSTVVICGYTDIVGEMDYNLNLSAERAQGAQAILQDAVAKTNVTGVVYKTNGFGETGTFFPNTLPEERFYNRTVVINILPVDPIVSR